MASLPQNEPVAAKGTAQRLVPHASEKPWGRHDLGAWGVSPPGAKIGEIHHRMLEESDPALLVKTLFTGERLSVQVHPDAAAARAAGHSRGKDEAWVVLAADPGATIGLGLKATCEAETLRAAALDGSIIDMMVWHSCQPGDVFFCPAGTVHAIGAGVTLFEVQQNLDLTYRLYDYGRQRSLHLDEALGVAVLAGWAPPEVPRVWGRGRELLVEGPGFVLERVLIGGSGTVGPAQDGAVWIAVVSGEVEICGERACAGEVWHAADEVTVSGDALVLLAYPGAAAANGIWRGE